MNTPFNRFQLKLLRQFNRLSLEELGELLECTRQYVHKVETGQTIPSPELIQRAATYFNVPEELFTHVKPVLQEDQIHFRSLKSTKVATKQVVIARGEYIKRLTEYLDSKLRLPKYDTPGF